MGGGAGNTLRLCDIEIAGVCGRGGGEATRVADTKLSPSRHKLVIQSRDCARAQRRAGFHRAQTTGHSRGVLGIGGRPSVGVRGPFHGAPDWAIGMGCGRS
jgi:hypothetical protein